MSHVVTAPIVAISVPVGAHASQVRFLEQGTVLPEGVPASDLEHLQSVGMIAELEEVEPEPVDGSGEPEAPVDEPQGEPAGEESVDLDALNLDELRTSAAENGIDSGDATRKADIRAAIDASRA